MEQDHPEHWVEELRGPLLVPLDSRSHKRSRGQLLILAGSRGLSGAARMVGAGALRAGCGLVRLLVPCSVRAECAADSALMVQGLPETSAGSVAFPALKPVLALAQEAADACVLGPGLGRHDETQALVCTLLPRLRCALVLDADALHAISPLPNGAAVATRWVLTPHEGEAARLLGWGAGEVAANRIAAALELAQRSGAVVVLKGHETLVAQGQRVGFCRCGNPGLARGGSGDVLAGVIGALLASGLAAWEAACAGVWIHGTAADQAAKNCGERALTIDRLLEAMVAVMASCETPR